MRYPTGVVRFDRLLHGGLPAGLVELSGLDGSGKTALALSVAREAGLAGLPCALIHMQGGAPDTDFIKTAGHNMAVVTPPFGEAGVEAAYACLSRGFRVVVVDSFTNLRPRCEDDLLVGDRASGATRLAYHAATILRDRALLTDSLILCTSELRANLKGFGTISAYESVWRHCANMRVRLARDEVRGEYGTVQSVTVRMTVVSSELLGIGVVGQAHLRQAQGLDRNLELLLALVESGMLRQVGGYWKGFSRMFGPGYERAAAQIGQRYGQYREELDGNAG